MADTLDSALAVIAPQLAHRARIGDQLDVPRQIDHTAFFQRKSAAREAALALQELGYRVSVSGGLLKSTLEANRVDSLAGDAPERFTREVYGVVAAHGGAYDGWGGEVRQAEDPAPARGPLIGFTTGLSPDLTRGSAVFGIAFGNGALAGRSRNAFRRLQSWERTARRQGQTIEELRIREMPGSSRDAQRNEMQAVMNHLRANDGKF
ncbi:ribonuclease E inhibitor RraB [Frondihabitans cladoniiphilus]|uniref:Regulator of ribonuclease activity B domain-containing protein n=1 Tax=Frondihabitans cladoniiphilus TaxID=715785 RepID=A0ABP8VU27_9MICO